MGGLVERGPGIRQLLPVSIAVTCIDSCYLYRQLLPVSTAVSH